MILRGLMGARTQGCFQLRRRKWRQNGKAGWTCLRSGGWPRFLARGGRRSGGKARLFRDFLTGLLCGGGGGRSRSLTPIRKKRDWVRDDNGLGRRRGGGKSLTPKGVSYSVGLRRVRWRTGGELWRRRTGLSDRVGPQRPRKTGHYMLNEFGASGRHWSAGRWARLLGL